MKINKIDTLFDALDFYHSLMDNNDANITLDFSDASFIRNNYLGVIGLALEIKISQGINIDVVEAKRDKVKVSMRKIGFVSKYLNDTYKSIISDTMIPYTRIDLGDYDSLAVFYTDFTQKLKNNVSNMSDALSTKITQKIFELFSNVFRHSDSKLGFISSGQFYPNSDSFTFTIIDGGVTIEKNVNDYLAQKHEEQRTKLDMVLNKNKYVPCSSCEAIEWSLKEQNSTTGAGGLGLSLLHQLILISNGKLEIVSNGGFFSLKQGHILKMDLNKSFKGTIVSVELNTCQDKYYCLKGENNAN